MLHCINEYKYKYVMKVKMVLLPIMPIQLPINGDERFDSWQDNTEFMTNIDTFKNLCSCSCDLGCIKHSTTGIFGVSL